MDMDLQDVLKAEFVAAMTNKIGFDLIILERPASFIVKAKQENERNINRVIILPPRGHTSNEINQTNCFEGVERATIQFKGAVRDGKKGFSKLKRGLLEISFNQGALGGKLDKPYIEYDIADPEPKFNKKEHNSHGAPFHVVKTDGTGFYHTLINSTDDWLALKLHKIMRPQKAPDLKAVLTTMPTEYAYVLRELETYVVKHGDKLFHDNLELVNKVLAIPPGVLLPALGEMLWIRDTGEHETCTAFALLLKVSNEDPDKVLDYLYATLEHGVVPKFFAEQLISKIESKLTAVPEITLKFG